MKTCKTRSVLSWSLQISAAAILAQTLFFKFSGAGESKRIFSALGAEPWGRITIGAAELAAVVLLMAPRTVLPGALLALGLMTGAISAHLTRLGIIVGDDGGLLFTLAVLVLLCSAGILVLRRREIPSFGSLLRTLPGRPSESTVRHKHASHP